MGAAYSRASGVAFGRQAPTTNGPTHRQKNQAFSFDCVLGPDGVCGARGRGHCACTDAHVRAATQEQVYNKTAKEVIPCLLDGFNASVFAYGQTSAGKTFTMLGDRVKGEGVMVRALKDLFDGERRASCACVQMR